MGSATKRDRTKKTYAIKALDPTQPMDFNKNVEESSLLLHSIMGTFTIEEIRALSPDRRFTMMNDLFFAIEGALRKNSNGPAPAIFNNFNFPKNNLPTGDQAPVKTVAELEAHVMDMTDGDSAEHLQ